MKKFGKFLTIFLALVIAVTALVVIGAADDAGTEATVISDETGFLNAIAKGGSYKLGDNITLSPAVETTKADGTTAYFYHINTFNTVSIDLNGKTLDMSNRYLNIEDAGSAVTVTITGEGTIKTSSGSYIAVVYRNAAGTVNSLSINGTGEKGITVVQEASGNAVFQAGNSNALGCNVTLSGKLTFQPYVGRSDGVHLFVVGTKGKNLDEAANLTLDGATVTIKEHSTAASNAKQYNGAWFASVGDGANVVIKKSTITMEHGSFIKSDSFQTHAYTAASGSDGKVTGVSVAVPTFTAKIDIDNSKISALNSGYGATSGVQNTYGGTLFNIGKDPVEIRVDDTNLVGTNRTIGCGDANRGQYSISPTYYYFTNVNFTTAPTSYYESSWLIQEHVNMKWVGGVIDLKNGKASGVTTPAGYLAYGGTYYSDEIAYGVDEGSNNVGWSGVLFSNCYFVTQPTTNVKFADGAGNYTFTLGGTTYTNVAAIKDGELVKCVCACVDDSIALVGNRTSMLDDGDGYTITAGTASGTKKYGSIFEYNIGSGKYEDTTAGYVKLSLDKDTATSNSHYIGLWYFGDETDVAHKNENGTFVVSEFDIATDTGTFNVGTWGLLSRFEKHAWKLNEAGTEIVDDGQLKRTDNGNTFRAVNGNYKAFYINADGTLDLSGRYTTYAKDANGNDITSVKLKTDGSWARISIVYEMIAEKVTYPPVEGSDLEKEAWDFSKSKAHLYIDGVWAATKVGIFNNSDSLWQMNNATVDLRVDVEQADTFNLASLRFEYSNSYPTNGTASTCIDNVRVSYCTPSNAAKVDALTAISADAKSVNLNDYKNDFLVMPTSEKLTLPTATVNWVDANGNTLGTSTLTAGSTVGSVTPEASVLAQANALRNELNNGWFDYGFSGWKVTDAEGNELASTDTLTKDATYTFTAVCEKLIAPAKGVSGIKLNLSLRMNFDLNIYIPVPDKDSGISSVTLTGATLSVNDPAKTDDKGQCTVEGDPYTKYRDKYGVAQLTSKTYTLSYTVGSTVITQDITYGVSDYVAQYMAKKDGDELAQKLIMQMVNYAIAVVDHPSSNVSDDIKNGTVAENYRALLASEKFGGLVAKTGTDYFSTDDAVTSRIKKYKTTREKTLTDEEGNVTKQSVAYYIGGARLYFGTDSTPTFMFRYTDAVQSEVQQVNGAVSWGKDIYTYLGYGSYQRNSLHVKYNGDWYTAINSEAINNTSSGAQSYSVYDMLGGIRITIYEGENDVAASSYAVAYCIEEYIADVIAQKNADEPTATQADVELAIALYDYAKASYKFVYGKDYQP